MKHAPGVRCIIHGLRDTWSRRDNRRLVRIVRLERIDRHGRNIWLVEPADDGGRLHGYVMVSGVRYEAVESLRAGVGQWHLLPIGDDDLVRSEFARTEPSNAV